MSEKAYNPHKKIRYTWDRDPEEHAHSTKKGAKGYDRNRWKDDVRRKLNGDLEEDEDDSD
ncbi:MAG: hypothetical protein GC154_18640 [bacterium]|nr:hypothetical protein [bacterium]